MKRLLLALALSWIASGAAGAAAAQHAWLSFEQRPGTATTLPAPVRALTPERHAGLAAEGHPYVDLLRRNEISLGPDGLLEERIVVVRHLLNDAGVRSHGSLTHWARPLLDRVVVEEAWVSLPDGRISEFDPATLQVLSGGEPDLFTDSAQLVFPFSKLEPGATIVLVMRNLEEIGRWPLPWSRLYVPQSLVPIQSFEVTVSWEAADPSQRPHWASDDPELRCTEAPGVLSCFRRQSPALAYDPDVVWADRVPHLAVGAARSWRELTRRLGRLVEEAAARDDGLDALAETLGLEEGSEAERLDRAQRFVADRVRYAGFEHGVNAVVPHDAETTLARRYGDCKDKVALFLALARRSGLDAWPVLVATARFEPEKLIAPGWRYFDHMIACVRLATGASTCVDLTDPHARSGELPLALEGAVALDLREAARGPRALPASVHSWRIEVEARNEVTCDGTIVEELERRFVGASAGVIRHQVASMNAAERRRWLEEGYAEVMGDRAQPELDLIGAEGSGASLSLRSTTRFTGGLPIRKLTHYREPDSWLVYYGSQLRSQNQHHPYRTPGLHLSVRSVYLVCPEVRIGAPGATLDFASEFGTLERRYERDGEGAMVVTTELEVPRRLVEPTRLERYNRFLDRALGETRIWFALEPGGTGRP